MHERTCSTCLTITNRLYPISFECKDDYKKIVEMETEEMEICNICHWQFRKFLKFKQQCQTARALLMDAVEMKLTLCQNLERTITDVHSFAKPNCDLRESLAPSPVNPPINDPESDVDIKSSIASPVQDDEFNNEYEVTNGDNDEENPQENNTTDNLSPNNPPMDNSSEDLQDTEIIYEESLQTLKNKKRGKKKKRKIDMVSDEDAVITHTMPKKTKNEPKEGFTPRMVQETDEYVVIKLTKSQVLAEMAERSKTELYISYPFKCEKCIKGFNFEDVLRTHMEKHTRENGKFMCDMCFQYCPSAVSLRGHVKSHTTKYKCKLCSVVRISRQHVLEHFSISHTIGAALYSCDSCTFKTNKRTVMQRHVKNHVKTEPHTCDQCGKHFKTVHTLRVHTIRHNKSSKFQCKQCDNSFVYQSLLRRHVTDVHERRDHYCVECDAHFKSKVTLRMHYRKAKKHRDASLYKFECTQCSVRCLSAGSLAAHSASAHGAARAHACALCRRMYSNRGALRAHVWRVHATRHTDIDKKS